MDDKNLHILSYIARVNESWFAVSMLEKFLWAFEVHDQEFADYAYDHGVEIGFDELPHDIYKCFQAAFLVIAEKTWEIEEW